LFVNAPALALTSATATSLFDAFPCQRRENVHKPCSALGHRGGDIELMMGTVAVRIAIGAAILAVGLTGCSNGSGYRTEMRAAIWAVRSVSERNVEIVVINGGCIDYDHTDIELHADLV